ncbi:Protein kinase-like domain [Pseudocohnilembus persalinus]|uniref:Protein kinase-like domain n=1 Tax=Pseudocohnilembus persalinus TaxID=266149 RepID=A0A0V0QKL3_PSEPJ|nr:Protein kinase-like domain [Pseudocohnilembus persalinus]|eukprot:KRX02710.1 Protein kinase-like domain [Pseudocohnilembus persalinus]
MDQYHSHADVKIEEYQIKSFQFKILSGESQKTNLHKILKLQEQETMGQQEGSARKQQLKINNNNNFSENQDTNNTENIQIQNKLQNQIQGNQDQNQVQNCQELKKQVFVPSGLVLKSAFHVLENFLSNDNTTSGNFGQASDNSLELEENFQQNQNLFSQNQRRSQTQIEQEGMDGQQQAQLVDKHTYNCEYLKNEYQILKTLKHKNIVIAFQYFENLKVLQPNQKQCAMVLEEANQDLQALLINKKAKLSLIRYIFREISEGLHYVHSQDLAHNDVKCSNVLIFKEKQKMNVKLADFEMARKIRFFQNAQQQKSAWANRNLEYAAPELAKLVNQKSQSKQIVDEQKCDVFAFGVILFKCVFKQLPFSKDQENGANQNDSLYKNLKKNKRNFWSKFQKQIKDYESEESDCRIDDLKNLIQGCLEVNYYERFNMQDVLNHAWFNGGEKLEVENQVHYKKNLHSFLNNNNNISVNNNNNNFNLCYNQSLYNNYDNGMSFNGQKQQQQQNNGTKVQLSLNYLNLGEKNGKQNSRQNYGLKAQRRKSQDNILKIQLNLNQNSDISMNSC